MKKFILLMLLIPFISPVLAKNEAKHAAKDVEKAIDRNDRDYRDGDWDDRDRDWDDELRKDLKKGGNGKGRPVNPGAHGRANAAMKQATNGKGGYKGNNGKGGYKGNNGNGGYDLEDAVRDELKDNDNKGGKNKNKGGKKH